MIQELELTHRHHMARPSPSIPLQIKICLHSFVFFCDDIGSLTFNRGRNTASDELQTQTQWRLWVKISAALWESAVTLCCVAFFIHLPPWRCVCVLCMWGPSVQARPGIPHDRQAGSHRRLVQGWGAELSLGRDGGVETRWPVIRGKWIQRRHA